MNDTIQVPVADADDASKGRIELFAAILLGAAGLLTAYAAYFGGLAGGDAIKGYSEATIERNEANGYYNDYTAQYAQDMSTFLEYWSLVAQGHDAIAEEIRARTFSPELEVATEHWMTLEGADDVPTPLDTDAYTVEAITSYEEHFDSSVAQFEQAAETDDRGDQMDLAGVYLAVSLFFAGIAAVFRSNRLAYVLLGGAAILLIPACLAIARGRGWTS